ncbi:unnamed protein product, partial [Acanthoscelides obtectus]
ITKSGPRLSPSPNGVDFGGKDKRHLSGKTKEQFRIRSRKLLGPSGFMTESSKDHRLPVCQTDKKVDAQGNIQSETIEL